MKITLIEILMYLKITLKKKEFNGKAVSGRFIVKKKLTEMIIKIKVKTQVQ